MVENLLCSGLPDVDHRQAKEVLRTYLLWTRVGLKEVVIRDHGPSPPSRGVVCGFLEAVFQQAAEAQKKPPAIDRRKLPPTRRRLAGGYGRGGTAPRDDIADPPLLRKYGRLRASLPTPGARAALRGR